MGGGATDAAANETGDIIAGASVILGNRWADDQWAIRH